jgi:hypothetical protein
MPKVYFRTLETVAIAVQKATQNKVGLTSVDGSTIRDDAVNRYGREDTNVRRNIEPAVQATADQLKAQPATRPPTRAEIEACSQRNASGENSIVGSMRASRLIREGKL